MPWFSALLVPSVLPAAALASGHANNNDPLAVPTWRGAQLGEFALTCPGKIL